MRRVRSGVLAVAVGAALAGAGAAWAEVDGQSRPLRPGDDIGVVHSPLTTVPLPPAALAGLAGLLVVMGASYLRRRRLRAV